MEDNVDKLLYELDWICNLDDMIHILITKDKTKMSDVQTHKIDDAVGLLIDVSNMKRAKIDRMMKEMGCDWSFDNPSIAKRVLEYLFKGEKTIRKE